MKLIFIIAIYALSASAASAASNKVEVVYGEDDRVDVYESLNSLHVELAKSTAAMIRGDRLSETDRGDIQILGKSLAERGICESERFSNQLSAADCSGFLVGENLLVTAGHCVRNQLSCESSKWVFDYKVENDAQFEVHVSKSDVYSCKRIIERSLDNWTKDDYALIELDRNVEGRRPLEYRKKGKVQTGDPLVVIGHPSGLPSKIADGANVRERNASHFVANLDTYGGNSGSAVFNAQTGVVEGILVRGEKDYILDPDLDCRLTNRLSNSGGKGEDVTYIGNIAELR